MMHAIDAAANNWNNTKNPKYKYLWYKLVKEFANGKNISNTNSSVRWDTNKRTLRIGEANENT